MQGPHPRVPLGTHPFLTEHSHGKLTSSSAPNLTFLAHGPPWKQALTPQVSLYTPLTWARDAGEAVFMD